jgi:hypothetical protein
MPSSPKSKIGLFLSTGYLSIVILATISAFASGVDLAPLIPLGLTMPWSFALLNLLDAVPDNAGIGYFGLVAFIFILALSAFLNAIILYIIGLLITLMTRLIRENQQT